MTKTLLSIIIPCYNSARFIASTLDMLVSQRLDGCEVIVVNDGSTDATLEIAKKYAEKYPEISVIDKENSGVSAARNTGMQAACGRYMYFLDSDDTLEDGTLDFYRKMLAENHGRVFFAFGYYTSRSGKLQKDYSAKKFDGEVLGRTQLKQSFLSKKLCFNICACICESSFLAEHSVRFTPGLKIGEDVEFLLKVMQFAPDCVYSARHCFVYHLRDDSAMRYDSYSMERARTIPLFYNALSVSFDCAKVERNFFLANYYAVQLISYLKSSAKDPFINAVFLEYEYVLKNKIKNSSGRAFAIKLIRIVGVRRLLNVFKKREETA